MSTKKNPGARKAPREIAAPVKQDKSVAPSVVVTKTTAPEDPPRLTPAEYAAREARARAQRRTFAQRVCAFASLDQARACRLDPELHFRTAG